MSIGRQYIAPQGLGSLASGTTYYLLSNRPEMDGITFAWFSRPKSEWRVHLIRLSRDYVETALKDGSLVESATQTTSPPWLADVEGISLDGLEDERINPVKTHREHATARLNAITPFLTEDFDREFDGAKRPEKCISKRIELEWPSNRKAESSHGNANSTGARVGKRPNAARAMLWYCTYRLFGRELESLRPSFSGIGKWSREGRPEGGKPLGRPNKREGLRHGHSAIPLASRIQNAYVRFADIGKPMTKIYDKALRKEFGCSVERLSNGQKRFFHPQGLSFPSYQQFRYWVLKKFGLEAVQRKRWGEARYRSRLAAQAGSFSQDSANYLETAEADVYFIEELPRQIGTDEPGSPLLVCRLADMVTGLIFGVGFSSGGEKAEAYALAKFCAAVPRALIGRMFGLPLTEDDWPGRGHPLRGIYDRGAGASPKGDGAGKPATPLKELAPSWSGQSKATVEASHPRNTNLEGEPTYTVSVLNVFQMAAREILRTPAENHRKDATGRLTPQMLADGVAANPFAITNYLIDRMRTSANQMSEQTAIRKYLRPVEFQYKEDGLWLGMLKFSSSHLHNIGLPTRAPKGQHIVIKGYIHPYSLYVAWVEIGGRLAEVEPLLRIRDDREQLQISLTDLLRLGELKRDAAARQREHGPAAMAEYNEAYFKQFGKDPDDVKRVRGRKPRPVDTGPTPMIDAKKTAA